MVDVGDKPVTDREAVARGSIAMSSGARPLIQSGGSKKGDPLQAARLAGIMAAKRTSELIPLCHPLTLSHVSVDLTPTAQGYDIEARVRTSGKTGVEMEALTAVAVAAPDALRHGEGRRQVDGDRRHRAHREERRAGAGFTRRMNNEERITKQPHFVICNSLFSIAR